MGEVMEMPKPGKGRPRKFETPEAFKEYWIKYVEAIWNNNFSEVISYTGFAKFARCGVRTVYQMLQDYPELKEFVMEPMADTLVVGAIKGHYKSTPSIFALKNRCGWVDKVEATNVNADKNVATKEEAEAKVKRLMEMRRA